MANQHGINISYEMGHEINKALFEGDTKVLFSLLAEYLRDNDLKIPKSNAAEPGLEKFDDISKSSFGSLMR